MSLLPGTRFGVYEVLALIGSGGMGEVYRARDTKLDRDVAIKILPQAFVADPERVARFAREAKTLASLNHPHIGGIYGLEERGGVTALVMELVEGEDVSQRIARGPIPIDEALPIAKQIAEALEAAHEQGIIHRDLKPANIKVRDDGTVKVLDFGLAKAMEPVIGSSPNVSQSPTITTPAMVTGVGMILGTAAYMSPEQARGKTVDKRADIWAFGAVLFEMLTGKRAFEDEDVSMTLSKVLQREPDFDALPPTVPARVSQALRVCLRKDSKQRVGDIRDVRLALEGAFETTDQGANVSPAAAAPRRAGWEHALLWVAGTVVLGGLAAWTGAALRPAAAARVARFVITTPADPPFHVIAFTSAVAVSPDGSRLVYRKDRLPVSTNGALYQRALGQVEATLIPGTEGAYGFFFSPDGNWIGFSTDRDRTLKRIGVGGGLAQTICALDGSLRGGSWGPDDTIVFATDTSKGLRRVRAAGGPAQVLTNVDAGNGETDHWWPEVLPDGKGVIFTAWHGAAERSRIVALTWPSGTISEVVRGGSQPHLSPTGHLVYAVGGTLSAVRFNTGRLEAVGNPVPVLEGVAYAPESGAASFAMAADGSLLYVKGSPNVVGQRTLAWVNRKGQEEPIPVPPRAYTYARLSPDGTRVALDARDQQNDIWIWDLARLTLQRLTNDPGMNRGPVWTPDSTRVAFTAERDGVESVYWQAFDGSGTMERLSTGTQPQFPTAFSPDGTRLVFVAGPDSPKALGVITLGATRTTTMLSTPKSDRNNNGEISPDGRWLAYESNESGRSEIYMRPFPNVETARQQVSTGGGTRPLWSRTGRELFYYVGPDTIMAVPVRLGTDVVLGNPQVAVKGPYAVAVNAGRHYDVSADGQRFLLLKDAPTPDAQKPVAHEIHLVQHWAEELKAKVPAGK